MHTLINIFVAVEPFTKIAETFTVEATTTHLDMALADKTMDIMEETYSPTNIVLQVAFLAEERGHLPWELAQVSWAVPWLVWPPCPCIISSGCTGLC